MTDSTASSTGPAPTIWLSLRARDAGALIRFLTDGLGFSETVVYRDGDRVEHAELAGPLGGGVMLGSAPEAPVDDPALAPGTSSAYVVVDDVDALHARAVAAGATVLLAPYDTDYGSRECAVADPEGNRWSLGTYRGQG